MTAEGAPARGEEQLHVFLSRLLGWTRDRAIDTAARSIDLAVRHLAELVPCGAGNTVPIARALHRRTLDPARPFVACDPHRTDPAGSVRVPENRASGEAAFAAARGGTLYLRARRPPPDLSTVADSAS
jgi:hypothetical protein